MASDNGKKAVRNAKISISKSKKIAQPRYDAAMTDHIKKVTAAAHEGIANALRSMNVAAGHIQGPPAHQDGGPLSDPWEPKIFLTFQFQLYPPPKSGS